MNRGRILKVRSGHEANCSSGMVALVVLVSAAVTLLPASLVVTGIQAFKQGPGKSPRWRWLYWAIPLVLSGLAIWAGYMMVIDSGHNTGFLVSFVFGTGGSFFLACLTGYVMAPRMDRPGWLVLMAPVILVAGSLLSLFISYFGVLVVGVGIVAMIVTGLRDA